MRNSDPVTFDLYFQGQKLQTVIKLFLQICLHLYDIRRRVALVRRLSIARLNISRFAAVQTALVAGSMCDIPRPVKLQYSQSIRLTRLPRAPDNQTANGVSRPASGAEPSRAEQRSAEPRGTERSRAEPSRLLSLLSGPHIHLCLCVQCTTDHLITFRPPLR